MMPSHARRMADTHGTEYIEIGAGQVNATKNIALDEPDYLLRMYSFSSLIPRIAANRPYGPSIIRA